MELTKRTKVAGGVLALALGFLIWDRWSAPASASAATEATPASTPSTPSSPQSAATPSKASPEQQLHQGALADRLDQLSSSSGSRGADAFAAPMEWFPEPVIAKPAKAKPENTPVDLSRHVLKAVLEGPGLPTTALVDGHAMKVGQKWSSPDGDETIELLDASKAGGGRARVRINGREGELKVQNARKGEGAGGS